VLNEMGVLETSVRNLHSFAKTRLQDWNWHILVADNGSSDGTDLLAVRLSQELDRLGSFRLEQRGRGRALRKAWTESQADVLCYMDVDLSTGLDALPPLLQALRGDFDLGTGTRHAPGSHVKRSLKREIISRGYNVLARFALGSKLTDHQCGFKGITRQAALELLPHVRNNHWFFDTELFALAGWAGYRIREVPVTWYEDPDSRVKLASTMLEDLRGMARIRRARRATLQALSRTRSGADK
jgi:glycosyltransferase involved in cell wall biosynthesis